MLTAYELIRRHGAERFPRTVLVPQPSAGAAWSFTVPGGDALILMSIRLRLVTDANVANRRPALTLTDGLTEFFRINALTSQAATLTDEYSYVNGIGAAWNPNQDYSLPLPPEGVLMLPGYVLGHTVANLQAGDQYSNVVLRVLDLPLRGIGASVAYTEAERAIMDALEAKTSGVGS